MLQLNQVSYRYSGSAWALRDISLHLSAGESKALLGPNGSGKSTLLKLVGQLIEPTSGSVKWSSKRPALGWLPASVVPTAFLKVKEVVRQLAELRGNYSPAYAQRFVSSLALEPLLDKPVTDLSFGQVQRVRLAQLLIAKPRLLLLDEPSTGIDLEGALCLEQLIVDAQSEGVSCIYATHQVDEAVRICQGAWVLKGGEMATSLDESDWQPGPNLTERLRRIALNERAA
ncbi:ABC transporter ATP-binding protein [Neiella sp. HB171785]|uniref:ABC transporter ATP-binding protein n=1 Tax=Neiella litorisoli TaxID=2771431 RepID=A0A8J6QIM8_9GAMM|nr:ABC transporter ATP-binding protein [Neiella litorisoli]MBD1389393.1 ABC transporter ATP-binding protein [Neiella litorisoli]